MKLIFSEDFINKVKEANDIIDVASEYFDLKQYGDVYKTRCKHRGGDKTPSLTFFPKTQSFYCFGCHAGRRDGNTNGSDVISFVQWVEEIEWQDAVIMLADRQGLEIPKAELSNEDKQKKALFDAVLNENRVYWSNLISEKGKEVKEWFYSRGINDADIAKWRLGACCPTSSQEGAMIPVYTIIDEYNRSVSFSKRFNSDDAKYKNGPTTPIFKKGSIIYGLNFIKKEIRRNNYIVIVEGYNDAIILQKYGVPAGAIMSSLITETQAELIKKYTNNVILFLDGDPAGIDGTISNIKLLKSKGIEVEVINILGFDPDELGLKLKEKTLGFILANKKLAFQFLINNVLDKYFDKMMKLKKETINQLEEILEYIEDDTEKKLYKDLLVNIISLEENKD